MLHKEHELSSKVQGTSRNALELLYEHRGEINVAAQIQLPYDAQMEAMLFPLTTLDIVMNENSDYDIATSSNGLIRVDPKRNHHDYHHSTPPLDLTIDCSIDAEDDDAHPPSEEAKVTGEKVKRRNAVDPRAARMSRVSRSTTRSERQLNSPSKGRQSKIIDGPSSFRRFRYSVLDF